MYSQNYLALILMQVPSELLSPLASFGIGGIVIAITCWYIVHKDKSHKEERADMRKDLVESRKEFLLQLDKIMDTNQEDRKQFVDAIRKNTELLYEVKTSRVR